MKKRVLLITQYFYPENFKSNDIAFELVKRGYEVDALVGIPNYPEGKIYNGYGFLKKRVEVVDGVNVYRSFQIPRGKNSGVKLMINYISYVISSCINVLFFFIWKKKYDSIIVHATSPIFQAFPAILYKKIRKVPIYLWVLDIWPDSLRSGCGFKNEKIISFVDLIVKFIYSSCDKILISSRRMTESICPKGDYKDKIVYFPNWSADMLDMSVDYPIPKLPVGFIIMIAGNIGGAQNLEVLLEVILRLRDIDELKWVFVGDGSKKEWLEKERADNGLEDNIYLLGRFPYDAMPAFYKKANAMFVTLKSGFPHLEMIVPSRLQSYMSAGRPVLAMIGNGGADIINESECGYAVAADDVEAFIDIIRTKVLSDKENFENKGKLGRASFVENFTKERCMDNLEKIINI